MMCVTPSPSHHGLWMSFSCLGEGLGLKVIPGSKGGVATVLGGLCGLSVHVSSRAPGRCSLYKHRGLWQSDPGYGGRVSR